MGAHKDQVEEGKVGMSPAQARQAKNARCKARGQQRKYEIAKGTPRGEARRMFTSQS